MQALVQFPMCDSEVRMEEQALVQRILASSVFERSARLRDFLRYICDRALSGHPEEVHEQFIGHHVFNRPIDYNPTDDNIVRVSARKLRIKLHNYFETEGREEKWVVEIPKGGYLPVFRERPPQAIPIEEPKSAVGTRPGLSSRAWTVALALVVVVLLFQSIWHWRSARVTAADMTPSQPANFVADLFADSHGPVQVVVCDSALVLMERLAGKQFTLAGYADRTYLNFPKTLLGRPGLRPFWKVLATRQISNTGDQEVARRLYLSMSKYKSNVSVMNARNMIARNFMSGSFVLLGSAYSNPWASLFSKGLNFQLGITQIRDLHPSPGEQAVYTAKGQGGNEVNYARIALVPNLTNTGRILLVAGTSMQATEAAADFLLRQSTTQKLLSILGIDQAAAAPNFELLLETSSVDGTPKSVSIIAQRIHKNFIHGKKWRKYQ